MSIANLTQTTATQSDRPVADRKALFLSAAFLVSGFIVLVIATVFHPSDVDPNNHLATFTLAWVNAPDAEKAARFASAQSARWLEEAITGYQGFVLGGTLILVAALIVWTARVPRPIGYLLALGGVGYLAAGWILGVSGFAPEGAIPSYIAGFSPPIAGVWLLISAWRMPKPRETAPESGSHLSRTDVATA